MLSKPKHLAEEYASVFKDRSVVAAYAYREPYPAEIFAILAELITDEPRALLDAGCGTGPLARGLVGRVDRVDAVDFSEAMIETGRRLPGGDDPRLNWIAGNMEEVELRPPYALITAGQSLHWMAWEIVMPRFRSALTPGGYLAIVGSGIRASPRHTTWQDGIGEICARYSTNRDYQPHNLLVELSQRHLFEPLGRRTTAPVPFVQSVADYVESFHARNGLSRDRMAPEAAAAFDRAVTELVAPYATDGMLAFELTGSVVWGRPAQGGKNACVMI
jgi:SAM-dependent methyltransferase